MNCNWVWMQKPDMLRTAFYLSFVFRRVPLGSNSFGACNRILHSCSCLLQGHPLHLIWYQLDFLHPLTVGDNKSELHPSVSLLLISLDCFARSRHKNIRHSVLMHSHLHGVRRGATQAGLAPLVVQAASPSLQKLHTQCDIWPLKP